MADNTTLNTGSGGDTIASDDIGGVKFPRSKITIGADGTNDGDVSSANPLPALIRSEQVDDAAFTPATSRIVMVGAQLDNTATDSVDEGDGGALRMAANRCLYVCIRDNAGNERGLNIDASGNLTANITGTVTVGSHEVTNAGTFAVQAAQSGTWTVQPGNTANTTAWLVTGTGGTFPVTDSGGSLTVDNAGTFAVQATIAAGATNIAKAEDAASADGDVGVPSLAVRKATPANTSGADGDYEFLQMSAGRLWVSAVVDTALPAGTNAIGKLAANSGVDIGDVDVLSIAAGDNNIGNVDIVTVPTDPFGANADAASATGSISAKLRFIASTGIPITGTVTVGSHAVTNAGTFAVQESGSALTALQLIDDPVIADDAAFTPATSKVMMAGFEYDDTTPDSVDEGDAGAARMSANRNIYAQIRDAAGNERGVNVNASNQLSVSVDNTVTVTANAGTNLNTSALALESGGNLATIAALSRAEDAAHSTGHTGIMALSVRQDTAAALSGTDADYQPLITDGSGRLHVNVGNTVTVGSHAVTNAGTFAVQVDGSALTALQLIDDPIVADDAAFTPATTKVMMVGFEADEASTDSVDEGDGGAARMTLDRKIIVTPQPHTAGGLSIFRSLDLDETEEDVKTSAGCVYGAWVTNTATTTRWLKFYNAAAASVTVGSTTPVITIGIPGNTSDDISANFGPGGMGIMFDTAICVAATTGVADADTGAPAANDLIVNIFYK